MTQEVPEPEYQLPEGYKHLYTGKVRELWETPSGDVLFVATDRISAYDWILPTRIPDKGKVLTQASLWWFDQIADIVPNHVISTDVPAVVEGRAMICKRLDMLPVECVARGYLTGSGWVDYQRSGSVCDIALPDGLQDGSRLPEAIFTPATKAEFGDHDENVGFDYVVEAVGSQAAEHLRQLTLDVYQRAEQIARERGLILADTKFEFGHEQTAPETLIIADEVLTPDSSRYWPADKWTPGQPQESFDKQFVRNWLTSPVSGWDKSGTTPPPELPDEVVEQTRAKYIETYERLTGKQF
ncbi:MAG: phosphoribosylaminoimidazolesuccinocarboxamide synthase [Candidatus Nanopelagicales bacterium]